jgi:hypothetical protein
MKQLISVALNYGKSLKSDENDTNSESVYAECNLVLSEPQYTLSNTGHPVKSISISECELCVTKDSAKTLAEIFKGIHSKLVELEKRERSKK